jgi:tetratricopeptide (TPR) repeat protein
MKKFVMYILFSILGLSVFANPNQAFIDSANANYLNGWYDKAAAYYEQVLQGGFESPEVYYNLGNAYFKQNKIPEAILNFERAALIAPYDEDINYNLNLVRSYVTDDIEELPEFFLNSWFNMIRSFMSTNGWALTSLILFVLFMTLVFAYLFSRKVLIKKFTFWFGILCFIISIISFVFSYQQKKSITDHNYAIIFNPTVTVKSSPDDISTDLFILHEGTKVKLDDTIGDWIEIQIADGSIGWIKAEDVQLI